MPSVSDQFTVSSSHSHERLSRPVSHRQLCVPLFHTRGSSHPAVHTPWSTVPSVWGVSVEKRKWMVADARLRDAMPFSQKSIHRLNGVGLHPKRGQKTNHWSKIFFLKLIAYTYTCVYVYFTNSQSQCKMRLHETCKLLRFRKKIAGKRPPLWIKLGERSGCSPGFPVHYTPTWPLVHQLDSGICQSLEEFAAQTSTRYTLSNLASSPQRGRDTSTGLQ